MDEGTSILLQLLEKETLNKELLTQAIVYDLQTDEFFIQKAICLALRNYSKYDHRWVQHFIMGSHLESISDT
ncbi:DNA alkylation repair protein (fragment) [Oenococcus oeni]